MSKYRMIAEQMHVVHDTASIIVEEEDRISMLPDDIIHRILSFLDVKYAIETRKLSKKWKRIWTSMAYLNLNSKTIGNLPMLSKFVKHVRSRRDLLSAVSEVDLSFEGEASQLVGVVKTIVKYVYSHNITRLTIIWPRYNRRVLQLPWLFSSHTLKHLTLATTSAHYSGQSVAISTWDFPVLETLNLSDIPFGDDKDKSLNLFSKCVNLKDLTLHHCDMSRLDIFSVCAPRLSNLTITDHRGIPKVFRVVAPQLENLTITNPLLFPEVFNVVAPQLENLTASVSNTYSYRKTLYNSEGFYFLHLSTDGLDSLEKVNLSLPRPLCQKERYGTRLLDLFKKLRTAKFLILDMGIIEALSSSLDQILHETCPFNNLKCLRVKTVPLDHITTMHTQVINYLLQNSPSATFIMDLPQVSHKRSRQEVDKDNMAKKIARLEVDKQQLKTMAKETRSRREVDKGTMAKKALLYQLSHEPSLFNNLKRLRQTDRIQRMSTQVRNYLHETSSSTTFAVDLPQKSTRQKVDKGTMAKKLEKEGQPPETMAEEKRSRQEALPDQLSHETSPFNQLSHESFSFNNGMCLKQKDSTPRMPTQSGNYLLESSPSATFINDLPQVSPNRSKQEVDMAKKLAMLEEEKQQTEAITTEEKKRILEEKVQMQDETIAQQKATMETMKLQHEKRTLEAKIEMQDKIIAQQKSMLEAMKLQHENGILEAKIEMQDLVIAEQKSMLEAMKLQHVKKRLVEKMQSQDDIIAQQKETLEAMRLHQ